MSCYGCKNRFVGPGTNTNAKLVVIGSSVGMKDRPGNPFTGFSALDFDNVVLPRNGLRRDDLRVTNVVQCYWEDQSKIPEDTLRYCARKHLPDHLKQAEVVALMGSKACSVVGLNVQRDHGRARYMKIREWDWEGIVVPCRHPAETSHDPKVLQTVIDDFAIVKKALKGDVDGGITDPLPRHTITITSDPIDGLSMPLPDIPAGEPCAIDTEWDTANNDAPICLTYAVSQQVGCMIRADNPTALESFQTQIQDACPILLHNQDEDLKKLSEMGITVPSDRIIDTMAMAYHRGLPQGLKDLAWKLLGMEWYEYGELVKPFHQQIMMDWVEQAMATVSLIKIPTGKRVVKEKSHPLLKKLEKLYQSDIEGWYGKLTKWKDREELETLCGPIPQESLLLVPEELMADYATADAVATLRLFLKMRHQRLKVIF